MTKPVDIDEISARLETYPEPIGVTAHDLYLAGPTPIVGVTLHYRPSDRLPAHAEPYADFLRHAPADLAALVAEVRSLRDVAKAAEAMLTGLIVDYDAGNTDRQMNDLGAALDAWRAGGEG